MFRKRSLNEVVVRGLDVKYIDRMEEVSKGKAGVYAAMDHLTRRLAELEEEKSDIWADLEEEYSLSKDRYQMDIEKAEIIRLAK